jgi:hypothetical protein
MIENASSARTTHTRSGPLDFMAHLPQTVIQAKPAVEGNTARAKAVREAWQLHQHLRGRSGIFAINAASPAGVMEYPVLPRPSERLSIQPFATIPEIVCLPAGCSFANGNPGVARNCCSAVRSRLWGRWLGRAGINSPSPLTLGRSTAFLGAAALLSAREIFRSPEVRCDGAAPVEARKRSLAASLPFVLALAVSSTSFLRLQPNLDAPADGS